METGKSPQKPAQMKEEAKTSIFASYSMSKFIEMGKIQAVKVLVNCLYISLLHLCIYQPLKMPLSLPLHAQNALHVSLSLAPKRSL